MEFLKSSKRQSLVSELIYKALNIGLAIGILLVILVTESLLPAFVVFALSKWRMFAVRPRYWFANIQANLVDIIVGLSLIVMLYAASGSLFTQILLTTLYAGWLLFVKPRSKRVFVAFQAGVATFLGVTALMTVSYNWYASFVVIFMWLIGYSTARHVLSSYSESHRSFYSLIWGVIFAELGWLAYHWTFAYSIPGTGDIQLSQAALIALALSFLAERVYASYHKHEGVETNDITLPVLLTVSVILVIMLFFNTLDQGTI